jgi:hypothetical protein
VHSASSIAGAVFYAGAYRVGVGLERFYRLGSGLARKERREIYQATRSGRYCRVGG